MVFDKRTLNGSSCVNAMNQSMVPLPPLPKEISIREHDYSIRLIKIKAPKRNNKPPKTVTPAECNVKYELTELLIEPLLTNVVKAISPNGTPMQFSTNIPLEDICHTDDVLEITTIDNSAPNVPKIVHLNETCKVCLKDLLDSPDKIPFFDEIGQITPAIVNISAAMQLMSIEITNDNKTPKQMCIECYNIFCKMSLFKQICKRSNRALTNIYEFTVWQQLNAKTEDNINVSLDAPPDIIEIKDEPADDQPVMTNDTELNPLFDMDNAEMDTGKSFICIRCGFNFVDQICLMRHKRYDLCVNPHNPECRVCNENLPSLKDLDVHLESDHLCFPCTKCSYAFNTLPKLNNHQRTHETLVCDFCAQIFYSKRTIREHLVTHVVGSYPCHFCKERFKTGKSLGIHEKRVHAGALYKCSHCPKEYKLRDRLRVHLMKHNPDKRFKCTYCPSQFVHRHHFENHVRTHTKENPFLCNFCGKAFRGENSLRDHLSIHDPETYPQRSRYYRPKTTKKCSKCNFTGSHNILKKHMIYEHGQSGQTKSKRHEVKEFEFICDVCDKAFRKIESLLNHQRIHDEVRDFHCTYCKASFRKPHYLRLHIDGVHLNKRPNKCDQCDAAYLVSNDLRRHKLQRHSTERPYQCYMCNKTFAMSLNLKMHINRTHRINS